MTLILAIDQGTTNSKAFVIDEDGNIIAQASRPMVVEHPNPGWAQIDPKAIWETVSETIVEIATGRDILAVAISNQRESILMWDGESGEPIGPCILWQCRRSSDICDQIRKDGFEKLIVEKSGLGIDPLFPAAKLQWLLDNIPIARDKARNNQLCAGTVDSWLLWNLTSGTAHATDSSNASRTQLMNLDNICWDPELLQLFNIPVEILPKIKPSNSLFGYTSSNIAGLGGQIPIHSMMGDSHASFFGHGIRGPGKVKVTIGTGSSLMAATPKRSNSSHGLSSTIAWSIDEETQYALEGNISVSGQSAAFGCKLLGLRSEDELVDLAKSVADNGGVVVVPALAGLGAPHWKDRARGQITGLTLATSQAHLARAILEAIALQIRDVFVAMETDFGSVLPEVFVDGGAAANDFLMQILADILNRKIRRPFVTEVTSIGAARMAGEALGLWSNGNVERETVFTPQMGQAERTKILSLWYAAIEKAKQE